jgi:hypothetical protein
MDTRDSDLPRPEPTLERVIQAFAISPVTAGAPCAAALGLFMVFSGGIWSTSLWLRAVGGSALLVAAWAYPVTFILGVPLYVVLRKRVRLTGLNSTIAGATIGGLVALLGAAAPELRDNLLLRGLIGWPHLLVLGAACGALPGLTFCAIATRSIETFRNWPGAHRS